VRLRTATDALSLCEGRAHVLIQAMLNAPCSLAVRQCCALRPEHVAGHALDRPVLVDVFEPERRTEAGDGEVFTDVGGHTRLLVGAFENADGHSVQSYMNYIRKESYSGYDIDYAPRGQTWFVLSGENDQNVFYEKVMFSCNGRVISSFALIYPIASKAIFDPVVEGIEKTFRPGQNCGPYARS
jgi:hypothetical protein